MRAHNQHNSELLQKAAAYLKVDYSNHLDCNPIRKGPQNEYKAHARRQQTVERGDN